MICGNRANLTLCVKANPNNCSRNGHYTAKELYRLVSTGNNVYMLSSLNHMYKPEMLKVSCFTLEIKEFLRIPVQ